MYTCGNLMKRFLAISLALILFSSNIGLTMATHFCGGQAVISELMLGHNHLDCGMHAMDSERQPDKGTSIPEENGCCENEYLTVEIEGDLQITKAQTSLDFNFVAAFVHSFLDTAPLLPELEKPSYSQYSPPLLFRDIPVLNQVFII